MSKSFGLKLQHIRKKKLHLSLDAIAEVSGMSKSYHGHLENGNVKQPRHANIGNIARAYDIPYHIVKKAYYPKTTKREARINSLLLQILADEKLNLTKLGKKAMNEDWQKNTKLFIIRLYEKVYDKKLL